MITSFSATIANAIRQEAKTKQKRTKKRDQLDFESVEIQLADFMAMWWYLYRFCGFTFSNILFFFIIICVDNVFYH
jgi:hypothetical protein